MDHPDSFIKTEPGEQAAFSVVRPDESFARRQQRENKSDIPNVTTDDGTQRLR